MPLFQLPILAQPGLDVESQLSYGGPSRRVINAGRAIGGHERRPVVDFPPGVEIVYGIPLNLPNSQKRRELTLCGMVLVVNDADCMGIWKHRPIKRMKDDITANICDPNVTKETFCIWLRKSGIVTDARPWHKKEYRLDGYGDKFWDFYSKHKAAFEKAGFPFPHTMPTTSFIRRRHLMHGKA